MSQDLMNISAFKGMVPAGAFAALDPQNESLADGIGSSYGIVGYKGKVWTLRLRGETKQFNAQLADGSLVPAPFLDVIILRQLPNKSKSYYPAGTYQDGQLGTRPVCAALDGVTPDADIATPQSAACAVCPRNVLKLNAEGRKTRECADYKRLAVLIVPSQTKALLGAPLMEPVFLRVPAASLQELASLGDGMGQLGFHFSTFITRIGFVAEKPHPQMTFRALQKLTDNEAPMVLPMRDDLTSLRITGESEIGKPRAPITQIAVAQAAPAVAVVAPVVQAAPKPVIPETIDTGFGAIGTTVAAATATVTGPPQSNAVAGATIDAGFGAGGAAPIVVPQQAAGSTVNTVADTGPAEDADEDLDARVAALLPKMN